MSQKKINYEFLSFIQDYKKPLENSTPPILSGSKISTLFHRLPEILQCHTLFRIALADCIRNWDQDERLGDVFVGTFSKPIVLDIYSGFINNFSCKQFLHLQTELIFLLIHDIETSYKFLSCHGVGQNGSKTKISFGRFF